MSRLFYDSLSFFVRTMSLWTSSITSRATWRRGFRTTLLKAPPSPAKMAWRAPAAAAEARSTTPLYRTPVPLRSCSLWHTNTHTNKACRSSAPSTSGPSAPGEPGHQGTGQALRPFTTLTFDFNYFNSMMFKWSMTWNLLLRYIL